jgi:2'-5' RNA ligase
VTPTERPKSPRARLFVALDLPEDVLDALVAWRAGALSDRDDMRLLPPEALHVTLVFLGYRYEREVERIAAIALGEPAGPFDLRAKGLVGVPRGRPRLVALSLADTDGALIRWQELLSKRLEKARLYQPEKRAFWPHVTLARVKRSARRPAPAPAAEAPAALRGPIRPERATLYRSKLRREGAVYEPLESLDLS